MLGREVQPSFSDVWYRVGQTRPRLSAHARITRQQYGPQVSYVIEDPAGGGYYRLSAPAYFFVGLLDGRRTADDAWEACCAQMGDDAPTQRECVDVLSKLQLHGLILGAEPLNWDMLQERQRRLRSERIAKRTGRGFFWTIPIWNPERLLAQSAYLWRAVWSRVGLAVWGVLVLAAALTAIAHAGALLGGLNAMLDPANLPVLGLLFIGIRLLHELGHATACKAMGGRCTEIGVILVALLLPLPYCDASSAWRMPEIRKRVLVSAGGMLAEGALAAVAVFIWVATNEGTIAHALAYQTIIISGITTFLFNANPLLRYDGYYILSDLAGSPNLAGRAKELWSYLIHRRAFGVRGMTPPVVRDRGELWLLLVYGLLSPPYRMIVGITIVMVVSSRYLTLGLVIGVLMAVAMLLGPLVKAVGHVLGAPVLVGRRARAVGISLAALALIAAGVGLVPVRAGAYATGFIEPAARQMARTGEDGFVREVLVRAGQRVRAGDVLAVLDNPQLAADAEVKRAQLASAIIERDRAAAAGAAEALAAEEKVRALRAEIARLDERRECLTLRAEFDGLVGAVRGAGIDLDSLRGRFLARGSLIATVTSEAAPVVHAAVSDRDRAYIFRDDRIERVRASARVLGRAGRLIEARAERMSPVAARSLIDAALSTDAGGELLLDPGDPDRRRTLDPYALVRVTLVDAEGVRPGQRVRVRFEAAPAPLAAQVWRRIGGELSKRFMP
ncbi:MAG: PqqD family peptide modification chaperone [Phycisphaerales bacterium]|nr:PqqD family peptide modification chaperone [Phycisphaerales bacterium]